MPANDPQMWTAIVNVASTSYSPTADLNGPDYIVPGLWSIHNGSATVALVVSRNGVDDAFTIPPGVAYSPPFSRIGGDLWLRLNAAGSATVTANLTAVASGDL